MIKYENEISDKADNKGNGNNVTRGSIQWEIGRGKEERICKTDSSIWNES